MSDFDFAFKNTTMDIARPSNVRKKRIRQAIYASVGLLVVVLVSVALSRLKPAAPTVERAVLWPDTAKRGPMVRQVRGLGTLTPEDIRWIPATTQGRVEKIILRPGTTVKANDVVLELTNPQLEQQLLDATLKLQAAEAGLANIKVQLNNDLLARAARGTAVAGRPGPGPSAAHAATARRAESAGRPGRHAATRAGGSRPA